MGSSLITAHTVPKVTTILFALRGMGEAPLCSRFSVWHLLREDGNIVELQVSMESPEGRGGLGTAGPLCVSSPAACF